jgi:hypothetical protein
MFKDIDANKSNKFPEQVTRIMESIISEKERNSELDKNVKSPAASKKNDWLNGEQDHSYKTMSNGKGHSKKDLSVPRTLKPLYAQPTNETNEKFKVLTDTKE